MEVACPLLVESISPRTYTAFPTLIHAYMHNLLLQFQGVGVREIANHCPDCHAAVPRIPNTKEFAELAEDMRVRIIRAEKTSYRKQFEEGMLDRVAVLALNNLADTITDIPHK